MWNGCKLEQVNTSDLMNDVLSLLFKSHLLNIMFFSFLPFYFLSVTFTPVTSNYGLQKYTFCNNIKCNLRIHEASTYCPNQNSQITPAITGNLFFCTYFYSYSFFTTQLIVIFIYFSLVQTATLSLHACPFCLFLYSAFCSLLDVKCPWHAAVIQSFLNWK